MIEIHLTDQEIQDLNEAIDDPSHSEKTKIKLLVIRLSESQSRRFMKSLGLKLRKTAPVPGKCDHQLQFDFYTRELLPRLEEARLGERKVIFVDTAHFVLGSFLGLIWCFHRIFLKTSPGRQRYNIFGAIDSHNQEFTSIRTTENINALTIEC
jgi:hypothetical protein